MRRAITEFLRFLEGIRTPLFNNVFLAVTLLGDAWFTAAVCVVLLWCVDKRRGFKLVFFLLAGVVTNQFLKNLFRVPRPFVRDRGFAVVEGAKPNGYSFPSGHTQSAVSVYGGAAYLWRGRALTTVSAVIIILVAFSRMYLGAHTPADVLFPLLFDGAMIVVLNAGFDKSERSAPLRLLFGCVLLAVPVAALILGLSQEGENNWLGLGAVVGLVLAREFDLRFVRYESAGAWPVQVLKAASGAALTLLLYFGLDKWFALFGSPPALSGVKAMAVVFFAAGIYPVTFKYWARLGRPRS